MSNGKPTIISLIVQLIKKVVSNHIKMTEYFLTPYEAFDGDLDVNVDLSNYPTKADFVGAAGVDTSNLAAKTDLARLKAEVVK